jgi:hypothetical protein
MSTQSYSEVDVFKILMEEGLSTRAEQVCQEGGFHTLQDLLDFYEQYNTFTVINGCGERTNDELIELCEKFTS